MSRDVMHNILKRLSSLPQIPGLVAPALIGLSLFLSWPASASNPIAASCDGCSSAGMSNKAVAQAQNGIVYVFNHNHRSVSKFQIITEVIDYNPYTKWTQAIPLTVETDLKDAYLEFAATLDDVDGSTHPLPDTFPVRTIAGAMENPTQFGAHFTDLLRTGFLGLDTKAQSFIDSWLSNLLSFADLGKIETAGSAILVFSDGSTLPVNIQVSPVQGSGDVKYVITKLFDEARLADGSIPPSDTSDANWEGFYEEGPGDTIGEWLDRAIAAGVPIIGDQAQARSSPGPVAIACAESNGQVLTCTVTFPNRP